MNRLRQSVRRVWDGLRALFGDDAYDRYVLHLRRHHPANPPLARAEFHRAEMDRHWSGVNRCC